MRTLAKVVLVRDGKILLLRRSKTDVRRPGQWDVPGGSVDPGEDLNTAAARETEEEAGITVDPLKLNLVYAENKIDPEFGLVVWLFFAEKTEQEEVALSYEHDEAQWMTPKDAIEAIDYPLHKRLVEFLVENKILEELKLL